MKSNQYYNRGQLEFSGLVGRLILQIVRPLYRVRHVILRFRRAKELECRLNRKSLRYQSKSGPKSGSDSL